MRLVCGFLIVVLPQPKAQKIPMGKLDAISSVNMPLTHNLLGTHLLSRKVASILCP